MSRAILRVLVSHPNEVKFAILQILEAQNHVDQILFVEHNYTHTGFKKAFTFQDFEEEILKYSAIDNINFLYIDLTDDIIENASNSQEMHFNETLMRKSFLTEVSLRNQDFVYLVDADEIIFGKYFKFTNAAMKILGAFLPGIRLPMHQFFYKMNYLWKDFTFASTTVNSVRQLRCDDRRLRDFGVKFPIKIGSHYSWQLTLPEMITKIRSYAHNADYSELADARILETAISEKKYPFDPGRDFKIEELTKQESTKYYPSSFNRVETKFEYLFTEQWIH